MCLYDIFTVDLYRLIRIIFDPNGSMPVNYLRRLIDMGFLAEWDTQQNGNMHRPESSHRFVERQQWGSCYTHDASSCALAATIF